MTAEATYKFLKPSLEQLSQEEKEALCRLINGDPQPKKVKAKKKIKDPVHSAEYYEKRLLETVFNGNRKRKSHSGRSGSSD